MRLISGLLRLALNQFKIQRFVSLLHRMPSSKTHFWHTLVLSIIKYENHILCPYSIFHHPYSPSFSSGHYATGPSLGWEKQSFACG
jgi:hypothetical protein